MGWDRGGDEGQAFDSMVGGLIKDGQKFCRWLCRQLPGPQARVNELWEELGIENSDGQRPKLYRKETIKKGHYMLYYAIPKGICFESVKGKEKYFNDYLKGECIFNKEGHGKFSIEVYLGDIPTYKEFCFKLEEYEDLILPFPVGYTAGELLVEDLVKVPHLKVAGTTNTGKSNVLHNIVCSLAVNPVVELYVVDLALLEFSYTEKYVKKFAYEIDGALEILRELNKEMHERRYLLNRAGVEKIQKYKGELKYKVLVVDEFSFLYPENRKDEKRVETHQLLRDLAALARKVGIHLVLGTQRPDADIMPGRLKANLPGTISMRTINDVNSEIVLDNSAAARLPNITGRAIWQLGNYQREIQVMSLPLEKARDIFESQVERVPEGPGTSGNGGLFDGDKPGPGCKAFLPV